MIANLKPYGSYKESGLPWPGLVPEHWGKRRMKFLYKERVQKGFPDEPLLAATQSKGVVRKEKYGVRTVTAMKDLHLLKLVEMGDFVISLRSFQGGIEVAHERGIISPAYTILAPRHEASQGYYTRFLKSPDFVSSLTLFVTGIREGQTVDYERLSRAYLPLPPADEQHAIGRYLDWANGRLERAIRAKRKVIALLNEQKQAIIHRAVTRGLDPSVPLKPSGIPWLGDIPKHWEVWPLRRCISIRSGDFVDPLELRDEKSDFQFIPVVGGNGVLGFTNRANNRGPTIVIGRVGALCGNVHLVAGDVWVTDNALRITRIAGFIVSFLAEQLRTLNLNRLANANAQPLITGGMIKSQRVVKPPQDEQIRIAEKIPALVAPIVASMSRIEREIILLREYRTRLVADVVMGKLDVREAAARLPDEAPQDSVNDDPDLSPDSDDALEEVAA